MRTTISVIKADVGGLAGHHIVPDQLLDIARRSLEEERKKGVIEDFYVTSVGDDLQLIMTHRKGEDSKEIHEIAWNTFKRAAEAAKDIGL
ncbi:fructose 1,6-bisphosphatase, partial [Candidatus Methanodesulfokora washburnensis]